MEGYLKEHETASRRMERNMSRGYLCIEEETLAGCAEWEVAEKKRRENRTETAEGERGWDEKHGA